MVSLVGGDGRPIFSFRVLPPLGKGDVRGMCRVVSGLERFSPGCVGVASRRDRVICLPRPSKGLGGAAMHGHPKAMTVTTTVRGGCNVRTIPRVVYGKFAGRRARCTLLSLGFLNVGGLLLLEKSSGPLSVTRGSLYLCRRRTASLRRRMGHFGRNVKLSNSGVRKVRAPFSCNVTYCPRGRRRTPGVRSSLFCLGRGMHGKTSCIIARVFFSGRGCCTFMRHYHRRNVRMPVVPKVGPMMFGGRLGMLPGIFHASVPRTFTSRLHGYAASRRIGTMNIR